MLLAYANGLLTPMPDFAVFADTQVEPKNVYDWLDKLEAAVAGRVRIIRATRGNMIDDYLAEGRRFAAIPFFTVAPDGSKGMARRQCTKEYKIEVIAKTIRKELGYKPRQKMRHHVRALIGISTDEAVRMKPSRIHWQTNIYPLIDELEWDRNRCADYVERLGLGRPPKSACYVCPFRSNESWRRLKRDEPEAFAKAVEFERVVQDRQKEKKFKGVPFLHSKRVPLDQVNFDHLSPVSTLFGEFGAECEGMCGV